MLDKFKRWLVLKIIGDKCAMFNCVIEHPDVTKKHGIQSNMTDFMFHNVSIVDSPTLKTSLIYSQNYYVKAVTDLILEDQESHILH